MKNSMTLALFIGPKTIYHINHDEIFLSFKFENLISHPSIEFVNKIN